jgi:hypothetical protein
MKSSCVCCSGMNVGEWVELCCTNLCRLYRSVL